VPFTGVISGPCVSASGCPNGTEREDVYYVDGVIVDAQFVCC
jgi:hypothetical protein